MDSNEQIGPPKWLRAPAAALFVGGIDVNQIYRAAQRGTVEACLSLEGHWYISLESLQRWKKEREGQRTRTAV